MQEQREPEHEDQHQAEDQVGTREQDERSRVQRGLAGSPPLSGKLTEVRDDR